MSKKQQKKKKRKSPLAFIKRLVSRQSESEFSRVLRSFDPATPEEADSLFDDSRFDAAFARMGRSGIDAAEVGIRLSDAMQKLVQATDEELTSTVDWGSTPEPEEVVQPTIRKIRFRNKP